MNTTINGLGERERELKPINGHRIFKCVNDKNETFYDVYDKECDFFETGRTLKEAHKIALNW